MPFSTILALELQYLSLVKIEKYMAIVLIGGGIVAFV